MKTEISVLVHRKTGDLAIIDFDKAIKSVDRVGKKIVVEIDIYKIEIGKNKRRWHSHWEYLGEY